MAVREAVSWKGRGRPSSSSAIASPSRTNDVAGTSRAAATTSGSRSVMSSRERVATRIVSPERWTWILIPSSFTSTANSPPPALAIAAARSGALDASIGSTGRPTSSPNPASASSPPVSAATATSGVEPASIALRRTTVSGTAAAAATASWSRASRAPCRTAPVTMPRSHACSSSVARPNSSTTAAFRAACEPEPAIAAIRSKSSWTSSTRRLGASAAGGRSLTPRQPRPVRRCRSDPAR